MINITTKQKIKAEIKTELDKWEMYIDLVKVQLHIGSNVPLVKLKNYSVNLERKFIKANEQFRDLEKVNDEKWEEVHGEIKHSIKHMEEIFRRVKQHY